MSVSDGGGKGTKLWPGHPEVTGATAMRDVALAAVRGSEPGPAAQARFVALANADPLRAEPFLVEGALALRRGDYRRAEALLVRARRLEPRSPSARYLLADLYLRQNRPLEAMAEMSVLNRLIPSGSMGLVDAFAEYVVKTGAVPQVRAILSAYPELQGPVLAGLAADARNASMVLALHQSGPPASDPPTWLPTLVTALLEAGEHRRAFQAWRQMTGARSELGTLFNPGFDASDAPPPFNWALASGSGAVVEPGAGSLNVLYFGREDVTLAEQTLLLAPGRYRLLMQVSGNTSGNDIRWSARCLGGSDKFFDLPVRAAGRPVPLASEFSLPIGCAAQRLMLLAEAREFPERADFHISRLQLARLGSR